MKQYCRCGRSKEVDKFHTVPVCPLCDSTKAKPKGEVNNGGVWAPMRHREYVKYNKIRNAQMAEYAANLEEVNRMVEARRVAVERALKATAGRIGHGVEKERHEWAHVFNLANIGKYYLCLMLRETADILLDIDKINKGDDPWGLGGSA